MKMFKLLAFVLAVLMIMTCAVSAGQDSQGNLYIISTGDAAGSWKCIYDHVALYHDYCASTSAEENNM